MASLRRGKRSLLPGLDPHTQSHRILCRALTGPQVSHHQGRPHQAGSCVRHGPIPGSTSGGSSVRFLGLPQDFQPRSPPAQSFDPARHSSWADVRPCKQGLLLDLKWTKTLQTQRGVTSIPLAALQDNRICPVVTCSPGLTQTGQPCSCSPLPRRLGRPSQLLPSEPCSIEQQSQ